MTTTNPGQAGPPPQSEWTPAGPRPEPRALRRSEHDRIISGVAGGLGEYFSVDPVIFRVLFAVLSFFGGVGLLAYGLAWLLIPEPTVGLSVLDKAVHQLRVHRVPPWLVIFGGVLLLWITWFSWWAPGPTFPALLLLAVVTVVLLQRLSRPAGPAARPARWPGRRRSADWSGAGGPAGAGAAEAAGAVDLTKTVPLGGTPTVPIGSPSAPTAPLIAPLGDTRRSMQAWLAEAGEAHRARILRRRPIKVGVGLALVAAWAFVAILDAFTRVPFPAYLWVGMSILGAGLVLSLITRRMVLSLLIPLALLGMVAIAMGGTRASLRDGSGQVGWMPTSASQLVDQRQFAGRSTLDLTSLAPLTAPKTIKITQAAGYVRVLLPATLNATVVADVHLGDIQNGTSRQTGQYAGGLNVHLELAPPAGTTGQPLTIQVELTDGHVQVDRVG